MREGDVKQLQNDWYQLGFMIPDVETQQQVFLNLEKKTCNSDQIKEVELIKEKSIFEFKTTGLETSESKASPCDTRRKQKEKPMNYGKTTNAPITSGSM